MKIKDTSFIKNREVATQELIDMAEYFGVSDRKQRGNRTLLRGDNVKYDLHEFLLAMTNKIKEIEKNAKRKKAGRPKKVDGANRGGKKGKEKLEGTVQS